MPGKPRIPEKKQEIHVERISDISGTVNIAGGNIITSQKTVYQTVPPPTAAEIRDAFEQMKRHLASHPKSSAAGQEQLQENVDQIQSAVTRAAGQNKKVGEGFLRTRFRNIARMAPDLLDVVVATWLGSPLAGLGVAVKKIADKAKAEAGTK